MWKEVLCYLIDTYHNDHVKNMWSLVDPTTHQYSTNNLRAIKSIYFCHKPHVNERIHYVLKVYFMKINF